MEKLDCRTLMIDDWVSLCGGTPIRVENVHGDCINFQHDIPFVQEEFMIEFTDIAPIPLTAEILEKNGFEFYDSFYQLLPQQWKGADNRVVLLNDDRFLNTFNKWHVHVDTEDMRTIGSIELTYVHQFQQLLRLCGLNDLADNFKI